MKAANSLNRILCGLLVCLLIASCGKTEKKRRTVGYKGEARSNAFLAAQRLLEKRGEAVISQSGISGLDYTSSTLFLSPSSLNTVGRAKRVMNWVDNGGHLVMMLSAGKKRGNDFHMRGESSWYYLEDETPGLTYLLEELHVQLIDLDHEPEAPVAISLEQDDWEGMAEGDRVLLGAEKIEFTLGGSSMNIHHWSEKSLKFDSQYAGDSGFGTAKGDDDSHRYLSLLYGVGRVSFLTDANPIRNRYIAYGDHARFVTELVSLSRDGTVIFSDGGGDHFFSMVWQFFWMAVLGVAAVIVLWLWKNLPRFGPPQDLPESEVREFSGQVRGIGRFLWRHKRDDTMLASLRRTVNRRLSLGEEGTHEGVFEQLSERTGLPMESVIEAMTRSQVREPGVMVRVVKNLQVILKKIN